MKTIQKTMKNIQMPGSPFVFRWAFCAVAAAGLCGPSISQGGPIIVQNFTWVATSSWRVTVGPPGGQTSETFGPSDPNGTLTPSATAPAGAGFTITKTKNGNIKITSTGSYEPTVERTAFAPPAPVVNPQVYVMGQTPSFPGELGYVSIVPVGSSLVSSASGGATVSLGIVGGYTADYVTQAGDTFQTIENNLVASLDANGVDAFIAGRSVDVISSISDQDTLAGAVAFGDGDTTLQFNEICGTVPDASSTLALLGIGVSLLGCAWRWRSAHV